MTDYKNIFKNTKGVSKRLFFGHSSTFGHFLVTPQVSSKAQYQYLQWIERILENYSR
jgi:hypothetical protein